MIVNFMPGSGVIDKIGDLNEWINANPDIARWVDGKPIKWLKREERGNSTTVGYISSIEFDNEDDCIYCCLRFGLW